MEAEEESIIDLKDEVSFDPSFTNPLENPSQASEETPINSELESDSSSEVKEDKEESQSVGSGKSQIDLDDEKPILCDSELEDSQEQEAPEEKPIKKCLKIKKEQEELFKNSLDSNSIIYLPTGCGKTLVSILAMHYYFMKYGTDRKIVFLANTITLVKQQAEAIKKYLPRISRHQNIINFMKNQVKHHHQIQFTEENIRDWIVCLHGQKTEYMGMTQRRLLETNIRDRRQLAQKIGKAKIVVMIAQMFLNCLRRGFTNISDYMLVVFDECHHCKQNHPFNGIMKQFYFQTKDQYRRVQDTENSIEVNKPPVIMGLTASPLSGVVYSRQKIEKQLKSLCINLDSDYLYYNYEEPNYQTNGSQAMLRNKREEVKVMSYELRQDEENFPKLEEYYKQIPNTKRPIDNSLDKVRVFFPSVFDLISDIDEAMESQIASHALSVMVMELKKSLLIRAIEIWLELGKFAYFLVFQDLTKEFQDLKTKKDTKLKEKLDQILQKHLSKMYEKFGQCRQENLSSKFLKLFEIIRDAIKEPDMRILVFAHQRRTVKYLQTIFTLFVEQNYTQQKMKLISNCVFGVGISKNIHDNNTYQAAEENLSNINSLIKESKLKYEEYDRMRRDELDMGISTNNNNIKNQQQKYDNSKLGRLMLEPEEKYNQQIQAIQAFRTHKIPILFSTSVTEEGFDIPHCKVVISFNAPNTLKSFIQIKGRARDKQSTYYILCDAEKQKQMEKSKAQYEATIEVMHQYAIGKFGKRSDRPNSGVEKPPFKRQENYKQVKIKGSGAVINTNNSIQILKSFINTTKGKIFRSFFGTSNPGFVCVLVMPGSGVEVIAGDIKATKSDAEKDAAFKAIKELRALRLINEDLRPKSLVQMDEQREIQKFNDLKLIKEDPEYHEVFKENVRVFFDGQKHRQILFFKSISSADIDFKQINPRFANHLKHSSDSRYKYQLYRISIENVKKLFPTDLHLNTEMKNLEIGLITCFASQDVSQLFSGSKYQIKQNSDYYNLELVDEQLELTNKEFQNLWQIHTFLLCTCLNQQIRYLNAMEPAVSLKVQSWNQKITRQKYRFFIDTSMKYYPLFTILQKDSQKKYSISTEINKRILEHEKLLRQTYRLHNNHKGMDRLPKEQSDRIKKDMKAFDMQKQRTSEFKNNYVIQLITRDSALNKCTIISATNVGRNPLVLKQMKTQSYDKTKYSNYYQKHEKIKKIFPHAQGLFDCIVSSNVLTKKIKQLSHEYFDKQDEIVKEIENSTNKRFLSEFTKHPLDIDLLFKLTIIQKYIMLKIRDYTRAYYFRNVVLNKIQEEAREKWKTEHYNVVYEFKMQLSIIDANYDQVIEVMKESTNPYFKKIVLAMVSGHTKHDKRQLPQIEAYIEKHKLNNIKAPNKLDFEKTRKDPLCRLINVNQVLRAITSKKYKSNKAENYEEHEFIGDCVLKLLATIQTFIELNKHDEGDLHLERARHISNSNLHVLSIKKQLFKYLLTGESGEPVAPLGLKKQDVTQTSEYKETGIKTIDMESNEQGYFYIPGKTHADAVQALVGIYYAHCRKKLEDCQFILYALGVLKYPTFSVKCDFKNPIPNRPYFREIESRLLHEFKNKNLIYQSFTHRTFEQIMTRTTDRELMKIRKEVQSNSEGIQNYLIQMNIKYINHIQKSKISGYQFYYERLQFLGDSVIDLVAVEYIRQKQVQRDEGIYSLLKQAVVSNRTLGLIALYWGFDEFMLIDSEEAVKTFESIKKKFAFYYNSPHELYTSQDSSLKVLGDVFQAYIGAVFLDSEFNYEYTKQICKRLMYPFIDRFTSDDVIKQFPQYKLMQSLQRNNFEDIRIEKNYDQMPIDGKYQYFLKDKNNEILTRCFESSEKKAWDELISKYTEESQ